MSKIALGTWAWGAGAFGGDAVFGSKTDVENLKPVFDAAMKAGLNLWDTATVYGMGESEKILGTFVAGEKRETVEVSTKFTPQLAEMFDNSVEKMADASPLIRRIESLHGTHTVEYAEQLGLGAQQYTLINLAEQTGIKSTESKSNLYNVYSLDGKKLHTNASSLDGLEKGTYIINGEKRIIE